MEGRFTVGLHLVGQRRKRPGRAYRDRGGGVYCDRGGDRYGATYRGKRAGVNLGNVVTTRATKTGKNVKLVGKYAGIMREFC